MLQRMTEREQLAAVVPFAGLLIAALLMAGVMADAAGYRWCDQHRDIHCLSATGGPNR